MNGMLSREVKIQNRIGLHARPATIFVQRATGFKSSVWVEKDDRRVNAKSLLGVLSMGLVKDMTVTIITDGTDEETAMQSMVELVTYELDEV